MIVRKLIFQIERNGYNNVWGIFIADTKDKSVLLSKPVFAGKLERLPLLLPALAMCVGIIFAWKVELNEWLWLGGCVLAACFTIFFSLHEHRRLMAHICLCASLFCLGGARFGQTYRTIKKMTSSHSQPKTRYPQP